jgi:predicted SAM-dependent methyltransferase
MLDVIEHLTPDQMKKALREANRVLKLGGKLIIHTNNYWFEKVGYWLIVASYHRLGTFRQKYLDQSKGMHINYMSKYALSEALKRSGFKSKVEVTIPSNLDEMKKYLPYGNRLQEYILHGLVFFF